jgi:predicted DCC family thiol-disulfide oxidoreductase YuxK
MGWILFFDGDCAFCSSGVRRVMRLDRRRRIRFAPLQGRFSREKGFEVHADPAGGTMVLLRESDGRVFLRSDAVVELTRALGGWWRIFLSARFLPRFLRDAAYRCVARNRYRLSKKGDFCVLPDPEMEARILE